MEIAMFFVLNCSGLSWGLINNEFRSIAPMGATEKRFRFGNSCVEGPA
jgi:hypothetical protein